MQFKNQYLMPRKNYKFKISIILCTYQSMSSLYHSLSNVLLQNFPQKYYEVIAISHGVPDGTDGYLFNCVQNKKRIFVPVDPDIPYQPNYVRNQGIAQAEGKLVLFLHDNVDLIGNDWLKRLWKSSNMGKNAVYTHKIVYKYQQKDGTIGRTDEIFGFYAQQDAIPLKFLKQVEGFDERYDGDSGMDDVDLMKRCEQKGGCYFYGDRDLMSIKHNLRDLFPEQKTVSNGERNRQIFSDKGFTHY